MSGDDFGLDRRELLRRLGVGGIGAGTGVYLGSSPAAATPKSSGPPGDEIDQLWDELVDLGAELLGRSIPFEGVRKSDLTVEEKRRRFRSLLEGANSSRSRGEEVSSQVYIPDVLPFGACYWTDFGADGKKICVEASPAHYGQPDCWQSTPTMGYVDLSVTTFDLKVDRSWEVRKDFAFWAGLTNDGCLWTGQEDLNLCSEVICEDDVLDWGSEVASLAEAALKAGIESVQEWVEKQDMIDWVFYAAAVLVALALLFVLWYIELPAIGAFLLLGA